MKRLPIKGKAASLILKATASFLFVAACHCCIAEGDTNIIAMGDWSAPVNYREVGQIGSGNDVRGRLMIWKGFRPGYGGATPEIAVYVEVENVTDAGSACELFFPGGQGLRCELFTANGTNVPPRIGGGYGNGPGCGGSSGWVTLLHDSSIRLRANSPAGAPAGFALRIPLCCGQWYIRTDDTNEYFMSGTLSITAPTNHVISPNLPNNSYVWQGDLTFPKMKILIPKP